MSEKFSKALSVEELADWAVDGEPHWDTTDARQLTAALHRCAASVVHALNMQTAAIEAQTDLLKGFAENLVAVQMRR